MTGPPHRGELVLDREWQNGRAKQPGYRGVKVTLGVYFVNLEFIAQGAFIYGPGFPTGPPMVGLSGVIGESGSGLGPMRESLVWTGEERVFDYDDAGVAVSSAHHPIVTDELPAETPDGDRLVWTWGNVFGVDTATGYRPLGDGVRAPAAACAGAVGRSGVAAIERLNGTFAGVVYDRSDGAVHLFTDRFGTHPIYYADHPDGGIVFSNHEQSLVRHPDLELAFEVAHLCEYFTTARISGCETPLTGVRMVPPGTVLTVDVESGAQRARQYWQPRYRPVDRPFSSFVERFASCFERVLNERLADDLTYGLLLSGGSDSRLVLAASDADLVGYHLSDWMSDEARIAERAALTAGAPFRWLQRDADYDRRVLGEVPEIMNFYGRFDQAHTCGFNRQLRDEVDVVISGLYADTLVRALPVPRPQLSLGPLGTVTFPTESSVASIGDFVAEKANPLPAFLDASIDLKDELSRHIGRRNGSIVHHGVEYPSIRELVSLSEFYPLSNDPDLFYYSLAMGVPHWTPFLDNRLVDLAMQMPLKYQLRRHTVNAAISRLAPDLAAIPHATTGFSLDSSFWTQFVGRYLTSTKRYKLPGNAPPVSYFSHDPWTDKAELITTTPLVEDTLDANRDLIERLPFVSWDGAMTCYRAHCDGGANHYELLTLLGFLEMPAVAELAETEPLQQEGLPPIGGRPP